MSKKTFNPYYVLDLENGCSVEKVKKKYRFLALQFHPDRNPTDPKSPAMFELATEAYRFLMDPVKKRKLDLDLERSKKKEYNLKYTQMRKLKKRSRGGVYSREKTNDSDFNAFVDECRENFREFFSKVEKLK